MFDYYYQTLDKIRSELLCEEYKLRNQMETFESDLRNMTSNL